MRNRYIIKNNCCEFARIIIARAHCHFYKIFVLQFPSQVNHVTRAFRCFFISCDDDFGFIVIRPGLEPGISGSGGRRLIHWANGPIPNSLEKDSACSLLLSRYILFAKIDVETKTTYFLDSRNACLNHQCTPCGTRTRNLRIRSPTPCPLGQGGR